MKINLPCRNIISIFLFTAIIPLLTHGQGGKENPFNLEITSTMDAYRRSIMNDSANCLIDLTRAVPGIVTDIRYATTSNFTHRQVYTSPRAFLRKPAATALAEVQQDLAKSGLGLKVFDAYRPYAATLLFWNLIHDTLFVADPAKGSRHNRGCAVDVTLVSLDDGRELDMPTPYDEFSAAAAANYQDIPEKAKANRQILIDAMAARGFQVMDSEWWHFDFQGWKGFGLMDLTFEELEE